MLTFRAVQHHGVDRQVAHRGDRLGGGRGAAVAQQVQRQQFADGLAQVLLVEPAAQLLHQLVGREGFGAHPLQHGGEMPLVGLIRQNQHELVAAGAGHGVPVAHTGLEPAGRDAKHRVAHPVTQSVVHLLETVEIDEHHGKAAGRVGLGPHAASAGVHRGPHDRETET